MTDWEEEAPLSSTRFIGQPSRPIEPVDPDEVIEIVFEVKSSGSPRTHLLRPSGDELAEVAAFARAAGLETEVSDHLVVAHGRARDVARALGTEVVHQLHPQARVKRSVAPVRLPGRILDLVADVQGIDDEPVSGSSDALADVLIEQLQPAPALARLYDFPKTTGKGQRIVLVELGRPHREADVEQFFKELQLPKPMIVVDPHVVGTNEALPLPASVAQLEALHRTWTQGGDVLNPEHRDACGTYEANMGIQLLGALAPGAEIRVVYAIQSLTGMSYGLRRALELDPTTICICYSSSEFNCVMQTGEPGSFVNAVERQLKAAAARDITVCVSSGDAGSSGNDDRAGNELYTHYPASSPYVLSVGGTRLLQFPGGLTEFAWKGSQGKFATGGGVSHMLPPPVWQLDIPRLPAPPPPGNNPHFDPNGGRCVPDVAAVADATNGAWVVVGGQHWPAHGTSAAAPVWSALVARLAESLNQRLGLRLVDFLYQHHRTHPLFNDAMGGDNDLRQGVSGPKQYMAGPGWDPCTGLGTPRGTAILDAITKFGLPSYRNPWTYPHRMPDGRYEWRTTFE